jgi:predicted RNase H-like nuclease (RuvC/YqgF family)
MNIDPPVSWEEQRYLDMKQERDALHSQAQEWERQYHNAIASSETFMADANRDRAKLEAIAMEQRGMIEKLHSQVRELVSEAAKDMTRNKRVIELEARITALEALVNWPQLVEDVKEAKEKGFGSILVGIPISAIEHAMTPVKEA